MTEQETVYVAKAMPKEPPSVYTTKIGETKGLAKEKVLESVAKWNLVSSVTLQNVEWDEDHVEKNDTIFDIKEKILYKDDHD